MVLVGRLLYCSHFCGKKIDFPIKEYVKLNVLSLNTLNNHVDKAYRMDRKTDVELTLKGQKLKERLEKFWIVFLSF